MTNRMGIGTNKEKHARYLAQNRREKNKLRKLKHIAKLQPNNKQIINLLGDNYVG